MKATDEDIGLCADMMVKAMGDQAINKELLEQSLKSDNLIVLVAKREEKIVGMVSGLAFPSMIPPPRLDFISVIDVESARKGLHGNQNYILYEDKLFIPIPLHHTI